MLSLQTRDLASGAISIRTEAVDRSQIGIVVVDMWNWHWCKTSTMRIGALLPRMNRVLAEARSLGMQIFLCPTDVTDNYVGTLMVEGLVGTDRVPVPHVRDLNCPNAPDGGGCTCGPERCRVNYGWDGLHPDFLVGEQDLMPNDQPTLYSLCRAKGITHLIYMGVHTQVCLLGKSIGLRAMSEAGLQCVLARDLTDAHGVYDPSAGITPDQFTADVVAHFEKYLAPSIDMKETLQHAKRWSDDRIVDAVLVAPWGTRMRPHLFESRISVTLSTPRQPHAQIRYTLDGTDPKPTSLLYEKALVVDSTTLLRAAAFEGNRLVCLSAEALFARLATKPPLPDLYLSDLRPVRAVGPGHSPTYSDHRFSPGSNPPQLDQSNRKQTLQLRGKPYLKGIGTHAPCQLVFDLDPAYERFVALAGVDEHMLEVNNGSNLARYPSVIFKVFVDGLEAAVSPVMRISEEPWRFDVPIKPGSHRMSIITTDAGDGNREDLGNWVNAGFILKRGEAVKR